MHFSSILALGSALFSTSVLAVPTPQLDLGLTLDGLNSCLFKDPVTKLTLDDTKVLDLSGNTCLSAAACLAINTNQIVKVNVKGVLQVPVCQRKTCPGTLSLNSQGLCVCLDTEIFGSSSKTSCIPKGQCTGTRAPVGSGSSAYCAPKTCPKTLTLVCIAPTPRAAS